MKNVILCGPPGSGKSTVGKQLAKQLQATFIDLDESIERAYTEKNGASLTCREITVKEGISFFRELEKEVVATLATQNLQNVVLATGGGVVETEANIAPLKSIGLIIYLRSEADELYPRVMRNGTPSYLDQKDPYGSFKKLLQKRNDSYIKIADKIVVTTSKTPEEIASEIIK